MKVICLGLGIDNKTTAQFFLYCTFFENPYRSKYDKAKGLFFPTY